MLDEIFNTYTQSKDNLLNIDDKNNNNENEKRKKDSFLNEEEALSTKKKTEEILSKYCTLYDKNSIKPLNIDYLNKKINRENLKNSTGPLWFNMKAKELTPEIKQDLKAIQLGRFSNPFEFHKKSDRKGYAKFFQFGTIQDNILDGKNNRLKKSEVKNRIVEELLDRDLQNNFSMRKFEEFQEKKRKIGLKKSKLNKYKINNKGKKKGIVTK